MAGNIVKWWKHKILGGYKQFSGKPKLHSYETLRFVLLCCKHARQHMYLDLYVYIVDLKFTTS